MGKALKAIAGVVITVVGFVTGNPSLIMTGVSMTFSALTAKDPEQPTSNESTEQRLSKRLEPEAFRKIVFGETAGGADVRYWEVFGTNMTSFVEVIALACHEVNAIKSLYFEDELAFSGTNTAASAPYTGAVTRALKTVGVSGAGIPSGGASKWTAASAFTGCAYYILNWTYSQEKLPNGIPSRYTAVVEGAKVYDPRRDSTRGGSGSHRADDQSTWEYSPLDSNGKPIGRNNALQMLWYQIGWRVNGKLVAGRGVDLADIDFAAFIVAANACEDEEWYSDCILSTGDSHTTNEAIIGSASGGKLLDTGGRFSYVVSINDTANIAASFDENDIVSEVNWSPRSSMSEQFNEIAGTFVDPAALYQPRPYPLVVDATYQTDDGFKRRRTTPLAAVQDPDQAQRLMRRVLDASRYQGEFKATFTYKALRVRNWDCVRLSFAPFGWVDKLFRVEAQAISPLGGIEMTLREESADVYGGPGPIICPQPQPGVKYDAFVQIPVTGLSSAATGVIATSGQAVDAIRLYWDVAPANVARTEVRYKRTGDAYWTYCPPLNRDESSILIHPLLATTGYTLEVRHVSINEIPGPWSTVTRTTNAVTRNAAGQLVYSDGTSIDSLRPLEAGANVTESRTAAGFAGQQPWATLTTPTARLNHLDNSGLFDNIANVTLRPITGLRRADNTTAITEAAVVTALGVASAVTGQGSLATSARTETEVWNLQAAFSPRSTWDFEGGVEGWAGFAATVAAANGVLTMTATGTDPQVFRLGMSLNGRLHRVLRVRARPLSASPTWEGTVYYSTAGHGFSGSYRKSIPNPGIVQNQWMIFEWDMGSLSAGGTDWLDNTITQIRIDLTNGQQDWEIDWISLGTYAVDPITLRSIADGATVGARSGTNLYRTDGTTVLTQAEVRTAEGTAAGFTGQGALATRSNVQNSHLPTDTQFSNILREPEFIDETAWALAGAGASYSTADAALSTIGARKGAVLNSVGSTSQYDFVWTSYLAPEAAGRIYLSYSWFASAGFNGRLSAQLYCEDRSGVISYAGVLSVVTGTVIAVDGWTTPLAADQSGVFRGYVAIPAGTVRCRLQILNNWNTDWATKTKAGRLVVSRVHGTYGLDLGRGVFRETGALLTDTLAVTSLGTAAAITGQQPWATSTIPTQNLVDSYLSARNAVVADFEEGAVHWTTAFGGSPSSVADPAFASYPYIANVGRVLRLNTSGSIYLTPKGVARPVVGRRYLCVARFKLNTAPSSGAVNTNFAINGLTSAYAHSGSPSYSSAAAPGFNQTKNGLTTGDGWVTIANVFTCTGSGAGDAGWRFRLDFSGAPVGAEIDVAFFLAGQDVTDVPISRVLTDLRRADATTALTESLVITSLGVASGITGQGPGATQTFPTYAGNAAALAAGLVPGQQYLNSSDSNRITTVVPATSSGPTSGAKSASITAGGSNATTWVSQCLVNFASVGATGFWDIAATLSQARVISGVSDHFGNWRIRESGSNAVLASGTFSVDNAGNTVTLVTFVEGDQSGKKAKVTSSTAVDIYFETQRSSGSNEIDSLTGSLTVTYTPTAA